MTAKELQKKYPETWDKIEKSVLEDIKVTGNSSPKTVAHNAAFEACFYFDQYIKDNCIITGKTIIVPE